jgi:16S rRNA (cytidine1402-2'-O)-methyltransferase
MNDTDQPIAPGLYLVGTPIGNLEDITLRALRVLRSVDRIACEDTRQSQKLLNHFDIQKPLISCHEYNEHERINKLLDELRQGARIALISDAGMPGISDPGMDLAAAAVAAGIAVYPIPGANAALTGLIASGLSTERFRFEGFLPEKSGARRTALESLIVSAEEVPPTLIFYEAPHRIVETLADLEAIFGADCRIALARELTKLHEEFLRGTVREVRAMLADKDRIRGEMTLVVEGRRKQAALSTSTTVEGRIKELATEGLDEKDALKRIARERNLSKSDVYRELQRERNKR